MKRDRLACDVCSVRTRAVCAALDDRERTELARLGHSRSLERGETVFAAGSENALCATLTSGVLKVSRFAADGTEQIVSLIHPSGFVGELFAPSADYDIIALTDCQLCVFRRAEYEQAIMRFPKLGRALLQRSSSDLAESRSLLAALGGKRAAQKVATFLVSLARAASDVDCHAAEEIDLALSRGEIASFLGLTIETVSRQLTRLEKEGVIRRKGARGVLILDAARLGSEAS